jgi:hypothetical protein
MIKVRPAINPATGEPFYYWHPSKFRQPIKPTGMIVPKDIFTMRALEDGTLVEMPDDPDVDVDDGDDSKTDDPIEAMSGQLGPKR